MTLEKYILNGRTPERCDDIEKFAMWYEKANRIVAKDVVGGGDVLVSTVFLGFDHQWDDGEPPLLFETMIFGGKHNETLERCSTWDQAVAGHASLLALAKSEFH